MRAVVQRVTSASVAVGEAVVGECGRGLLILVGAAAGDEAKDADALAVKVARLRIFENEGGKFDHSIVDVGGEALVVSQFTLIADTSRGNRPSFSNAAQHEHARSLIERFCATLAAQGVAVATGTFGARMSVALVNDGPVTIVLD
ncbi:MAG: D-tyrosyl-tRNA(Tyr) deacylase [Myxococcales bacterium]|nr:MAG: D-tyrosyl-tRNA(Tyr) deacylase [Myxococcales bacterium]